MQQPCRCGQLPQPRRASPPQPPPPRCRDTLISNLRRPFPGDARSDTWRAAQGYAFHKYGGHTPACGTFSATCRPGAGSSAGTTLAAVGARLDAAGQGAMGVHVTELNCYTAAISDSPDSPYFNNVRVMDLPQTAACLASQLAAVAAGGGRSGGGPAADSVVVFKMVQTLQYTGRVAKNGM